MAALAPPVPAQEGQVYGGDQFFQLIWEPVEDGGRLSVGGYVINNYGLEAINVRLMVESLDVHGRVIAKTIGYVNYPIPPRREASSRSSRLTSPRTSGCMCCHGTGDEAHPADACSPLGTRRGRASAAVLDRDGIRHDGPRCPGRHPARAGPYAGLSLRLPGRDVWILCHGRQWTGTVGMSHAPDGARRRRHRCAAPLSLADPARPRGGHGAVP